MEAVIRGSAIQLKAKKTIGINKWLHAILLIVLGYEALGCLAGGAMLMAEPDGRLMEMPVGMMHGAFPDFLIPGMILFCLGILNVIAFFSVIRGKPSDWFWAWLAVGGLLIWFTVEIAILRELHWLHAMWGLPVVLAAIAALPLFVTETAAMRKILLIFGIASSVLYVLMNIFVQMQWEGYNQSSQIVSELSAVDAPTRPFWFVLGVFYTLLMTGFGWGVRTSAAGNRRLRIAGNLLFVYGSLGVLWAFAPMHLREVLVAGGGTMSDTMHIALGAVTNIIYLLTLVITALALGRSFRLYSFATFAILLIFGILTFMDAPGIAKGEPTPFIGLWERITIGVFLLWVVVLATILLRKLRMAH